MSTAVIDGPVKVSKEALGFAPKRYEGKVIIQSTDGRWDKKKQKMTYPRSVQIPMRDSIKHKDGHFVPIHYFEKYATKTLATGQQVVQPHYEDFCIPMTGHRQLDAIEDRELIEYLSVCNYNADNPYRDKNKRPRFRILDPKATARMMKQRKRNNRMLVSQVNGLIGDRMALEAMAERINVPTSGRDNDDLADAIIEGTKRVSATAQMGEKEKEDIRAGQVQKMVDYIGSTLHDLHIQIRKGLADGHIYYKGSVQKWFWKDDSAMINVVPGQDPNEALENHLQTDAGQQDKTRLFKATGRIKVAESMKEKDGLPKEWFRSLDDKGMIIRNKDGRPNLKFLKEEFKEEYAKQYG